MTHQKTGRNDKCHCGSGKKFKQCCESRTAARGASPLLLIALACVAALGIYLVVSSVRHGSSTATSGKVWSAEHGHYH